MRIQAIPKLYAIRNNSEDLIAVSILDEDSGDSEKCGCPREFCVRQLFQSSMRIQAIPKDRH